MAGIQKKMFCMCFTMRFSKSTNSLGSKRFIEEDVEVIEKTKQYDVKNKKKAK